MITGSRGGVINPRDPSIPIIPTLGPESINTTCLHWAIGILRARGVDHLPPGLR